MAHLFLDRGTAAETETVGGDLGFAVWQRSVRRASVRSRWALRLRLASLVIPEMEAGNVELNGLLVARRRGDALHHELLLRDKRVTGIAPFVVAWAAPESRHAVIREPAVLQLSRGLGDGSRGLP